MILIEHCSIAAGYGGATANPMQSVVNNPCLPMTLVNRDYYTILSPCSQRKRHKKMGFYKFIIFVEGTSCPPATPAQNFLFFLYIEKGLCYNN